MAAHASIPDGGGYCDGGAPITCTNPLLNCRATNGVCAPATGVCSFAPLDGGEPCSDGLACTHSDHCGGNSTCNAVVFTCATSQCIDAGTCLGDGGCAFAFASATTACDDQTSCTHTDRCDGLGVCNGTGYSCTSPPVCFSGTACLGDGGCGWAFNGVDSGCPGGTCGPDAGCVPFASGFPYPPSNFDPAAIPGASIAPSTTFSGCTVEFDTTTNSFVDGGWCNQTKPVPVVVVQDGGISTTVLAMASFTLAPSSTLVLYGSRPVILAVYGAANVQGVIDARSLDLVRVGAGGDYPGCGASNGTNATALSAGGGGAGFGTAGSPGAGSGAGLAGTAAPDRSLRPLRGGCTGGQGHDSSNRWIADGGAGGGAVQLSAASTLTVAGTISVSGGGGRGGVSGSADDNGGGGAGSGGAILLEANALSVTTTARLVANGGAGGGGRADATGSGEPGQSGALDTSAVAVGGKGATAVAGDGGHGAAGSTGSTAGSPGSGTAGSGGGGAGLGVVRLNAASSCAIADAGLLISAALSRGPGCP